MTNGSILRAHDHVQQLVSPCILSLRTESEKLK